MWLPAALLLHPCCQPCVLLPRRVLQTQQHQLLWRQLKSLPCFCKHLIIFIHLHGELKTHVS